jgi:hypothetical protein
MLRFSVLALSALAFAALGHRSAQIPDHRPIARDTVQAGDAVVDAARLKPFSLSRRLTMTRGDTVKPFGRQSEQLTRDTLGGRPVLLDVLTFDTPNAITVDSSWIDARSLRPLRMRSSNSSRVVSLEFDGRRVRGGTTPQSGTRTTLDQQLGARPFEWNMFGLAVSALPLEVGYRATMPVYTDRFGRVVWYTVEVVRDTSLVRASGYRAPMWEVVATGDSAAPSARFWVSQRHRFVDQVLVWEPGVSILYARELAP